MRMIRLAATVLALFATTCPFLAQDRVRSKVSGNVVLDGYSDVLRAAYMREVWVGLASPMVPEPDLLKAMEQACSDTTTVAVMHRVIAVERGNLIEPDERAALNAVSARQHVLNVMRELGLVNIANEAMPWRKHVRVVLVGVMDTCDTALRVARSKGSELDGVVLIDPFVGDLVQIEEGARVVGVDILLHPRSENEFARDVAESRKRLGPWGKSARVLRCANPFDPLEARVAEAWTRLRGYSVPLGRAPDTHGVFVMPLNQLLLRTQDSRVVHVGELHGNPGAHRLQLEMLRALIETGGPLALSTEQFERDVQGRLDAYLKGEITEEEFLKESRPWPNYADYRPLIELCKEKKIPVIAGNIPRRLASRVHKEGIEVTDKFTDDEKSWTAKKLNATQGAYRDKFMKAMGSADGHNAKLDSMYAAQCIKDDTMAESIAEWLKVNPKGRVLHINGAFHSENGLGVPEKLKALMPEVKQAMLTCYEADKEPGKAVENEWYVRVPASRP